MSVRHGLPVIATCRQFQVLVKSYDRPPCHSHAISSKPDAAAIQAAHSIRCVCGVQPLDSFPASYGTRRFPILSQTNPVHTTPSHLSKIHLGLPNALSLWLSLQLPIRVPLRPIRATCPAHHTLSLCSSLNEQNSYSSLSGLSPRANYTDRATVACRRSWCQFLLLEGVA
jgi:hypothetical protein